MRIAYFECFSGISGDMLLGALLHAGISEDLLRQTVSALNIGAELQIHRVDRSGISATKVDVLVNGASPLHEHSEDHAQSHSDHDHAHDHPHPHVHSKEEHVPVKQYGY